MTSNIKEFLKFTAYCSFLGAITTALLIFLPKTPTNGFEESVFLYENKLYLSKLWILFLHPQFNFIASLGVAMIFYKKYPLQIVLGTLFFAIWAYTEISQQALLIDALNQFWRPTYASSDSEQTRTLFKTLITAASGLSDSKYFLVIYGFGLGSLLYGIALIHESSLAKWIGFSLVFIGILSVLSFIRYYLGADFLSPLVDWSYTWMYPYLQPIVRVAIGVLIFNKIKDHIGISTHSIK